MFVSDTQTLCLAPGAGDEQQAEQADAYIHWRVRICAAAAVLFVHQVTVLRSSLLWMILSGVQQPPTVGSSIVVINSWWLLCTHLAMQCLWHSCVGGCVAAMAASADATLPTDCSVQCVNRE